VHRADEREPRTELDLGTISEHPTNRAKGLKNTDSSPNWVLAPFRLEDVDSV
jgi:hypothetical protein